MRDLQMDSGWSIPQISTSPDAARVASAQAHDVSASPSPVAGTSDAEARRVSTEFEAMVLQNLLDTALPKSMDKLFGGGAGGSLWRSTLLEHVGRMMAERGDLQLIDQATSERIQSGAPTVGLRKE